MPVIPAETPIITDNDFYELFAIPEETAEAYDCKVVYPAPNELFIDIDSDDALALMQNRVEWFLTNMDGAARIESQETPSKSGLPHRHVILRVFDGEDTPYSFSEWERICLQFYFGSDPKRESLNTLRLFYSAGAEGGSVNCFFEPDPAPPRFGSGTPS